jgi:hypothetical protein
VSFQYGRDAREVFVNEPNPAAVRGEVGPRRLEGIDVPIDPHELGRRRSVQNPAGVATSPNRRVDDDPTALEGRREELRDLGGENRFMVQFVSSLVASSSDMFAE